MSHSQIKNQIGRAYVIDDYAWRLTWIYLPQINVYRLLLRLLFKAAERHFNILHAAQLKG